MDDDIVTKINSLVKKKKEINSEIKILKSKKKNGNGNLSTNTRVAHKFMIELEDIIVKRNELGRDDELSRPKITELIIRHKFWPSIKNDIVDFNPNINGGLNDNQ